MKKVPALLLSGILCLTTAGCGLIPGYGEDKKLREQAMELSKNLGDDIRSGKISLNGKEYTFPMELPELLNDGWRIIT